MFDSPVPSAENLRFGIVVAEWNNRVTTALLAGAVKTLREAGCLDHDIISSWKSSKRAVSITTN